MTLRSARGSAAFAGILVAALIGATPASASPVTIVDLGTLPGSRFSTALDMNDAGTVSASPTWAQAGLTGCDGTARE
jgi:hypothetical protein